MQEVTLIYVFIQSVYVLAGNKWMECFLGKSNLQQIYTNVPPQDKIGLHCFMLLLIYSEREAQLRWEKEKRH